MPAAATFDSRWATEEVPGIGSITGERAQQPGQRELRRRARRARLRGVAERAVRSLDSSPVASGNHGMNPMSCSLAVVEQRLGVAVGEVVEVLHRHDRRRSPGPPRARSTVTSDSPMCRILPSSLQLRRARRPGPRPAGPSGSMRCSWNRSIRSTPRRRRLSSHLLAQVRRVAERRPDARALPGQPGLGRDDDVVGVGVQRLADQLLGDVRAVGVGGVDEGDAELDGAAQHARPPRRGPSAVAPDARRR